MNKLIIIAAVAAVLATSGCATSRAIQGPSGSTAYVVKCAGTRIEECYQEASNVCPNGYVFADKAQGGGAMLFPVGGTFMLARGRNTLLVECK